MATNPKEFEQLEDKTFILRLTIPLSDIKLEHQHVLEHLQQNFTSKGFRKGKAPLDLVKSQISQEKIIDEILSAILNRLYRQKTEELQLKPIIQPQIKIIDPPLTLDKDWQIEITACQKPQLQLDVKYSSAISKINLSKPQDQTKEILDTLLKYTTIKLPPVLINSDLNHRLSQLIDQTTQAGITVSQYLKSKNLTLEQYQQDLAKQIASEWTLNLLIDHIAAAQKIVVQTEELDAYLKTHPELSDQSHLVNFVLLQDKVIAYLKSL
jgi:FKBP-type peptidyl-prolyl cis-trans isomerase (trigger factor)